LTETDPATLWKRYIQLTEAEWAFRISKDELEKGVNLAAEFLDNPFSIAAILAHELGHVIYSERIEDEPKTVGMRLKSDEGTLDEERSVDLLAFLFRIGEFQLRVARDKRLTLGYFDQEIFERIQIIVSKKLKPGGS